MWPSAKTIKGRAACQTEPYKALVFAEVGNGRRDSILVLIITKNGGSVFLPPMLTCLFAYQLPERTIQRSDH